MRPGMPNRGRDLSDRYVPLPLCCDRIPPSSPVMGDRFGRRTPRKPHQSPECCSGPCPPETDLREVAFWTSVPAGCNSAACVIPKVRGDDHLVLSGIHIETYRLRWWPEPNMSAARDILMRAVEMTDFTLDWKTDLKLILFLSSHFLGKYKVKQNVNTIKEKNWAFF